MVGRLDLSKLRDTSTADYDPAYEWQIREENALKLAEAMGAPLQRAIDAWNRRLAEREPLLGAEEGDLNDRIEDEVWLLRHHGYRVSRTIGPYRRQSADVSVRPGEDLSPAFGYEVYSLDDLTHYKETPTRYPATGGQQPGEFEQARDHADAIGGVVLKQRFWNVESHGADRLRCVHVSPTITPVDAYEAFMRMYDDGIVIARFIPVFERMLQREHRAVEAIADREPDHYRLLGEIAFYLGEVRSWKADRDWYVAQGKI
ncbi:hypothetical protein [Pseudaminobacter sp. NGMCC 1.201702]|uniref:hypothetical protein n=1 Tax=Pseudaminobacter sp. NGMCC 1.201702 TaxID=3391825 RepID=UPI0039EEDB0E